MNRINNMLNNPVVKSALKSTNDFVTKGKGNIEKLGQNKALNPEFRANLLKKAVTKGEQTGKFIGKRASNLPKSVLDARVKQARSILDKIPSSQADFNRKLGLVAKGGSAAVVLGCALKFSLGVKDQIEETFQIAKNTSTHLQTLADSSNSLEKEGSEVGENKKEDSSLDSSASVDSKIDLDKDNNTAVEIKETTNQEETKQPEKNTSWQQYIMDGVGSLSKDSRVIYTAGAVAAFGILTIAGSILFGKK